MLMISMYCISDTGKFVQRNGRRLVTMTLPISLIWILYSLLKLG